MLYNDIGYIIFIIKLGHDIVIPPFPFVLGPPESGTADNNVSISSIAENNHYLEYSIFNRSSFFMPNKIKYIVNKKKIACNVFF